MCYIKCVTQNELDVIGPSRVLFPRFERLYYSISAWTNGFMAACRPIIGLDGCHLKGVHGGQLLAAVSKDPNDRIFVIAIAVVDLECHDSWSWFLKSLFDDIGSIEDKGWTFISDQQKVNAGPRLRMRVCLTQQSTSRKSREAGPTRATQ